MSKRHLGGLLCDSAQQNLGQMFAISAAGMHIATWVAGLDGCMGDVLHGQVGEFLTDHLHGQLRKDTRRAVNAT